MAVSYKRLWKLLIDKDMKKSDLEREAGISHYTVYKLTCCANLFRCICKLRKGKNPLLLLVGRLSAKR